MALAASENPPQKVTTDKAGAYGSKKKGNSLILEMMPWAKHIESEGIDHPILNNNALERLNGVYRVT